MAIQEVRGNLIGLAETGQLDGLAHGCNCLHAMGSGVAGQLARRYPAVPQADIDDTIRGDRTKLGLLSYVQVQSVVSDDLFDVYNLYTQYAPSYDGSDVFEYDKFRDACRRVLGALQASINLGLIGDYKIGFPKIGAGLAGGDWERIKQIIVDVFSYGNVITAVLVEWDGSDLPPVVENHSQVHF